MPVLQSHGPWGYSRVRAHLLQVGKGAAICTAATQEMLDQFHREEAAAKAATEANMPRTVPMLVHQTSQCLLDYLQEQGHQRRRNRQVLFKVFTLNFDKWLMQLLQECSTLEVFLSTW
jgi:hypothetical protein